jgi:tetratricopeptide (TPR) repeat protein
MEDYGEGARKPSAIWEMTSKSLASHPHGQSWVRLAHVASFFSPEGFQKHVLRYLWGKLIAPDADSDLRFNQALEVLRRHGIISDSESELRMHRLTIAALRHSAREAEVDIEESIGKSLAMYEGMMPEDWLSLAGSIRIIHFIPDKIRFSKIDKIPMQVRLLCSNSEFEKECRWEVFTSRDWRRLLCLQAQYADRCPWDKIKRDDWVLLLCRQPQFADRYSLDRLRGSDWVQLLEFQPKFADRCTWKKLNGKDWARLLECQPKFADRCPWEKLNWRACVRLLESQPQLEDSCPWWKFEGADWVSFLEDHPKFADHCSWWKLNGSEWRLLLSRFADRFSLKNFNGSDWVVFLDWWECFADSCPWEKLSGGDWASLLGSYRGEQYADRCPWEKLSSDDWASLLGSGNGAQFADRCPWEEFSSGDWVSLLGSEKGAQFADRCPWEELTGNDWVSLLGSFRGEQYAGFCPWEKLSGSDWASLLVNDYESKFAKYCSWEKLSGCDWGVLLGSYRSEQYVDRCPWAKFSGIDWVGLLRKAPEYFDHCAWEKIKVNDWALGLDLQTPLVDRRICSDLETFFKRLGASAVRENGYDVKDLSELLTISRGLAETMPGVFNAYEANILDVLAEIHERNGEFELAVMEQSKSVKLRCAGPEFRKDNSVTLSVARSLGHIGVLHRALGDVDKAEKAFAEALDLIRGFMPHQYLRDQILLGNILVEYAGIHRDLGRFGQAENEYEETLILCRNMDSFVTNQPEDRYLLISLALTGLGVLHSKTKNLEKAENELKEALAIHEYLVKSNPELEKQLAETLHEYGKMLIKRGDRDKAKTNLKRALDIRLHLAQNAPKVFAKFIEETESILMDLQKDSMN